jgi:predicted nucleotidyltransferase
MKKIRLSDIKTKSIPILKKHGIKKAAIFGSYVRGEETKDSDIDMLVEFANVETKSLLDLIGLEQELEEFFNKKVDVITYKSIHPLLKDYILKEQEVFYEEGS